MGLKFCLPPLLFILSWALLICSKPSEVAEVFNYLRHGATYSDRAAFPLYCESDPSCVCNKEKDGYIFHCEKKLHVRLRYISTMTGFVYMTCNRTIKTHHLRRDYYSLLGLQRFRKVQLYLTDCPEPPESYASLLRPASTDTARMPEFFQLQINCGDRKDFSIVREHLDGLSELSILVISCSVLECLPDNLFQGEWSNLYSLTIKNTAVEQIPDGLFSNLSNLQHLIMHSNRIVEIRNQDFIGFRMLKNLRVEEDRLRSLGEDVFDSVTTLMGLELKNSKVTRLPRSFRKLTNLVNIELVGNYIQSIELADCEGFSNLLTISIVNNHIQRIEPGCFGNFSIATFISMSGNSLSILPDKPVVMGKLNKFLFNNNLKTILRVARFIESDSLRELEMTNSLIESIDPDFLHSLPNLQVVILRNNKLSYLHEDFFALNPCLKHIYLGENRFSIIPDNLLLNNPLLKIFHIPSNKIKKLPPSLFANCNSLDGMTFAGNELEVLPKPFLTNLRLLRFLVLSDNKIKTIENGSFGDVVNLMSLFLDHNMLEKVPTDLFSPFKEHGKLFLLDLEGNYIPSVPLLDIPSLEILNLANNNLKQVDKASFIHLERIKSLNLSRNNLEKLSDSPLVTENQTLHTLDLSFNQLHEIPYNFFQEAENLVRLDLSGNQIKEFDLEWILLAMKLREFDVSNNGLSFIGFKTFTYSGFPNVKILKLSNNQISFNYSSWAFDGVRKTWGRVSPLVSFLHVEEIHLVNNSISGIFMDWRNMLSKLRILDLRHNKLDYITHQELLFSSTTVYDNGTSAPYECSHSLKVDLRHNLIKGVELPPPMLMERSQIKDPERTRSHVTILMEDNPFNCGCEMLNFLRLINGDVLLTSEIWRTTGKDWVLPARIEVGNLSCWEPEAVRGKKLSETETWMHHILPTMGICFLLGLT